MVNDAVILFYHKLQSFLYQCIIIRAGLRDYQPHCSLVMLFKFLCQPQHTLEFLDRVPLGTFINFHYSSMNPTNEASPPHLTLLLLSLCHLRALGFQFFKMYHPWTSPAWISSAWLAPFFFWMIDIFVFCISIFQVVFPWDFC